MDAHDRQPAAQAGSRVVDAPHARDAHRLICLYTTTGIRAGERVKRTASADHFPLGRFEDHYRGGADVLPKLLSGPRPIDAVAWTPALADVEVRSASAYALEAGTRGHVVLVLELDYVADLMRTIPMLYDTAMGRRRLCARLDGHDVAFFHAMRSAIDDGEDGEFGPDVHQLVLPAADSHDLLIPAANGLPSPNRDRLARLVYRADEDYRVDSSALCLPLELNRPAGAVAGHARGVTVLAGAAEHVETAVMLTAVELLAAVSQLRVVRAALHRTQTDFQSGLGSRKSIKERRQQLAEQSGRLARLEVDLCFGVEAAMDAGHVPEVVLEPYRRSLAEALGVRAGAEQAANAIARLSAAIAAMRGAAESLERQASDNRRDLVTVLAFTISLVAFVLSGLFGYFSTGGNDVAPRRSIFDLGHYWPVYAALVVVLVLLLGLWLGLRGRAQRMDDKAAQEAVNAWNPVG